MRRIKKDWQDKSLYVGRKYVLVDPPWNYEWRPPKADAQVASKFEVWGDCITGNGGDFIRLMGLLDRDTTAAFVWCTWSMLEEIVSTYAFYTPSVPDTQFTLRSVITWVKLKELGGLKFGLGNSVRNATEALLIYVRKKAKPPRLQMPNVFSEYSGGRTRKPKNFERELVTALPGNWLYVFSGPEYEWARGLDIDLVDTCHDIKRGRKVFFK